MPTAKTRSRKTSGRRKTAKRGRLAPAKQARGLSAADIVLDLAQPDIAELAALVQKCGGAAIGAYREPLSGRSLLLAALPLEAVAPPPFPRDRSPAHANGLATRVDATRRFP